MIVLAGAQQAVNLGPTARVPARTQLALCLAQPCIGPFRASAVRVGANRAASGSSALAAASESAKMGRMHSKVREGVLGFL